MEIFPSGVLDELALRAFALSPALRITFLASLGPRIRDSAIRVLFHTLIVSDDTAALSAPESNVGPVLSNPTRYAHAVKVIAIRDPESHLRPRRKQWSSNPDNVNSQNDIKPIGADQLFSFLKLCSSLEEIVWESSLPPPEGLCEILSAHNHLSRFAYVPSSALPSLGNQSMRSSLPKWNALSLPLLSTLPIISLSLTRLSQSGAKALAALLSSNSEYSLLEDLSVDFVWLDDTLCEAIVEAGRRLRRLRIGTTGTKLTDKGISAVLEGCDALEAFSLDQVEGRLSRSLWTRPSQFPPALKGITVTINEVGPHHSWTMDHLHSLHALPTHSLEAFSIVRREPPPRVQGGTPIYEVVVDEAVTLKLVPHEFVDSIKRAKSLRTFECDWWAWSIADIKAVLESCVHLETIKLCLASSFLKLLNLTSTFAALPNLRRLSICVDPAHAPGKPPTPVVPTSRSSLPTPTESPALKSKSVLPQLLDLDHIHAQSFSTADVVGDPSMPLLRDIKRFVRKCPRLEVLDWYGNAGRGAWSITRPSQRTKSSINISIEYTPPAISEEMWYSLLRDQTIEDASRLGCNASTAYEREGQTWVGPAAEAAAVAAHAREVSSPSNDRERPSLVTKKSKPSSVSTSWLDCSPHDDPSPTGSSSTLAYSPTQQFSPLTPPVSDHSLSALLLPVARSAWPNDEPDDRPRLNRKRTPSEPGIPLATGRVNGRSRSATTITPSNDEVTNNGTSGVPSTRGSSSRSGRGRGIGGRGDKQNGNATNGRGGITPGRGRGGRRGIHSSSSSAVTRNKSAQA